MFFYQYRLGVGTDCVATISIGYLLATYVCAEFVALIYVYCCMSERSLMLVRSSFTETLVLQPIRLCVQFLGLIGLTELYIFKYRVLPRQNLILHIPL